MIDLTHSLNNSISIYPGTAAPKFIQTNNIEEHGFAEMSLNMRTHAGTHIDAPAHIIRGGKTLDLIPINKFTGKGLAIDCRGKDSIDLELLKKHRDKIERSDFILFCTGRDKHWGKVTYLDDFQILSPDASQFLLNYNLKAVGFDVISVDQMRCTELPNHNLFLKNEVLIIENLTNLEALLNKEFDFYCIPLKIEAADGSPVRAFARLIN